MRPKRNRIFSKVRVIFQASVYLLHQGCPILAGSLPPQLNLSTRVGGLKCNRHRGNKGEECSTAWGRGSEGVREGSKGSSLAKALRESFKGVSRWPEAWPAEQGEKM